MKIEITAMYYARFHIVYTKPYTQERCKRLYDALRECAAGLHLSDDNTRWFGHSKAVDGTYAGNDREAVELAATKLEEKLARMKIARLITVEEWSAHVAARNAQEQRR